VANRIRFAIESTPIKSLNCEEVHFTVSIGVAEQPADNPSEEWLIELADAAMYRAKSSGRNRVECTPTTYSQTSQAVVAE